MSERYAEIEASVVAMTEKAVLLNDGDGQEWVPFSCLEDGGRSLRDETAPFDTKVSIVEWKAVEMGWA